MNAAAHDAPCSRSATGANRIVSWLPVLLVAATTALAACGAIDDRPAAWGYISPVLFEPSCGTSSCHSRAAAVAGLDFSEPHRGYASLTKLWVWIVDPLGTLDEGCKPMDGKIFCQRPERPLVTPFDPAASRLVNLLRARDAPRMPPDRPLSEADIRLVERWILNGALEVAVGSTPDSGATASPAPTDGGAGVDGSAGNPTPDADAAGEAADGSPDRPSSQPFHD